MKHLKDFITSINSLQFDGGRVYRGACQSGTPPPPPFVSRALKPENISLDSVTSLDGRVSTSPKQIQEVPNAPISILHKRAEHVRQWGNAPILDNNAYIPFLNHSHFWSWEKGSSSVICLNCSGKQIKFELTPEGCIPFRDKIYSTPHQLYKALILEEIATLPTCEPIDEGSTFRELPCSLIAHGKNSLNYSVIRHLNGNLSLKDLKQKNISTKELISLMKIFIKFEQADKLRENLDLFSAKLNADVLTKLVSYAVEEQNDDALKLLSSTMCEQKIVDGFAKQIKEFRNKSIFKKMGTFSEEILELFDPFLIELDNRLSDSEKFLYLKTLVGEIYKTENIELYDFVNYLRNSKNLT